MSKEPGASLQFATALEEVLYLRAENATLKEALNDIAEHTDPDDKDNYRSDDREGCLDTVHAIATAARPTAQRST